ncbi:MAG: hypothetical protein IPI60_01120 [Saprospiraceae bacterium]|nr:hypothetical protein [Saprospiraceae bacterium]
MFALSSFIDFIFSVIVFFFVVSSLASIVTEIVAEQLNWRGKLLYNEVKKIFENKNSNLPNLGERVYKHPLVLGLKKRANRLPEEIPADIFTQVLVNEINEVISNNESQKEPESKSTMQSVSTDNISSFSMDVLPDSSLKKIINTLGLSTTTHRIENDQPETLNCASGVESWYTSFIGVLNYKYKGQIRWSLFIAGAILSFIMGLGTIHWMEKLYNDEVTRAAFVQLGDEIGSDTEGKYDPAINGKTLFPQYIRMLSKDTAKIAKLTLLFNTLNESNNDSLKRASTIELLQDTSMQTLYRDLLIQTKASLVDTSSNSFYNLQFPKIKQSGAEKGTPWFSIIFQILDHLLTGFIAAAGAPFWYDLIRKLYTVRKNKT